MHTWAFHWLHEIFYSHKSSSPFKIGVKNAKDRVRGSTGCIMHRVHTGTIKQHSDVAHLRFSWGKKSSCDWVWLLWSATQGSWALLCCCLKKHTGTEIKRKRQFWRWLKQPEELSYCALFGINKVVPFYVPGGFFLHMLWSSLAMLSSAIWNFILFCNKDGVQHFLQSLKQWNRAERDHSTRKGIHSPACLSLGSDFFLSEPWRCAWWAHHPTSWRSRTAPIARHRTCPAIAGPNMRITWLLSMAR